MEGSSCYLVKNPPVKEVGNSVIADKIDLNQSSVLLYLKKYKEVSAEYAICNVPGKGPNSYFIDDNNTY